MSHGEHHGGARVVVHLHDVGLHIVGKLPCQRIHLLFQRIVGFIHVRAVVVLQHDHGGTVAG